MDILFILFPDDWQGSPEKVPAGDTISVVFPARSPIGVIHIRTAVRDVDPELMTLSLQAGAGALFELSAGAAVDVLDENEDPDQPAGTASLIDEGNGVYHIEITFNVQDQQWTLFVENSAHTSASVSVAAAGTDDPDSDTLRPWIDLPKGKITLKSHGFQPAPESAEIRFRNCGTATLKITQSPGQPLPGDIFTLESVEPDVVEPGEEGKLVYRALEGKVGLLDHKIECNDKDDGHRRIQIEREEPKAPPQPWGPCNTCISRPPGQPKCNTFLGDPISLNSLCEREYCRHKLIAHS
ncbi:hypothetical protein [Nocardia sp. SC052]|uniref:hypothetical protein n=1 Tax=Nocardia sichangensis TaxID=3385975 RepID=UPI00399F4B3D